VHALAHGINEALGGYGTTVSFIAPVRPDGDDQAADRAALDAALAAGSVGALVIIGADPCYASPEAAEFGRRMRQVPLTLFAGLYETATARDALWTMPLAHVLESWGDARALDGTASIVQPLIAPLFGGRTRDELLAMIAGAARAPHDLVRDRWQRPDRLNADAWHASLRDGVIAATAATPVAVHADWTEIAGAVAREAPHAAAPLELLLTADYSIHDGRFANNPWLQELPDPITKLCWENAVHVGPATAARLQLATADVVDLSSAGATLRTPVVVVPGVADDLLVLSFGYGQSSGGSNLAGAGVNAYALWADRGRFAQPVSLVRVMDRGRPVRSALAFSQVYDTQSARPLLIELRQDELAAAPEHLRHEREPEPTLYDKTPTTGRQWAMAIDLSVCTGCSACVVACQAENNIPVVGKPAVREGRIMHWLRIDRYLLGPPARGRAGVQPMLCQHCEQAPCEYVCPVNATVHSPDGLNEMVYNRCVGTRFCSNNCPYKVRRFNWLDYTGDTPEPARLLWNPDVTVRGRGVMEKCTFCVQRIRRADIDAGVAGTDEPYRTLQTACQQACPTRAIVFGSLTDAPSAVAAAAAQGHSYQVLHDLGTRPRVHYLARLRNVNPAIPEALS
jgi:Fe-S-cluster-containing dehydrogenase component